MYKNRYSGQIIEAIQFLPNTQADIISLKVGNTNVLLNITMGGWRMEITGKSGTTTKGAALMVTNVTRKIPIFKYDWIINNQGSITKMGDVNFKQNYIYLPEEWELDPHLNNTSL